MLFEKKQNKDKIKVIKSPLAKLKMIRLQVKHLKVTLLIIESKGSND